MNLAAIPFVTRLLLISILTIFAASVLVTGGAFDFTSDQLLKLGADYGLYNLEGQWWRAITSIFLHINLLHLALNAWALLNLGSFAEASFGRRSYALIYFLSGIAGSMVSVWWNATRVSVGASGAVFGIAGAVIAARYFRKMQLDPAVLKKEQNRLTAVVAINLLAGALIPVIDNAAHVGGLLMGLACGSFLPMIPANRSEEEQSAATQRSVAVAMAALLAVVGMATAARSSHRPLLDSVRASELFEEGDYEQALKLVNSSIELQPDFAFAYVVRGYGYVIQGAYRRAVTDFQKALSLEPTNTQAMYQLGHVYRLQDENQKAVEQLSALLELQPGDVNAIAELGRTHLQLNQPQTAIDLISGAIRRRDNAELRIVGGRAYIAAGEFDPAIIWLKKAVELEPDNAEAYTFLGEAFRKKGMTEEAAKHFSKAGELRKPGRSQTDAKPNT